MTQTTPDTKADWADELANSLPLDSCGNIVATRLEVAEELRVFLSRHRSEREKVLEEALKAVLSHRALDERGDHVCWIGESTFLQAEQALALTPQAAEPKATPATSCKCASSEECWCGNWPKGASA